MNDTGNGQLYRDIKLTSAVACNFKKKCESSRQRERSSGKHRLRDRPPAKALTKLAVY